MRVHTPRAVLRVVGAAAAVGAALLPVTAAEAASRDWHGCSRTATTVAASLAGVPAALDANPRLRSIFGDQLPSATFHTVYRAYCADFDGDGDVDRAAQYACCTVSSPSPVAILRNNGASFEIVYKRFGAPIFRVRRSGRKLVLREPKYSSNDANCCPSRFRDRTLRWTGTRIKATVRIRRAASVG